MANSDYTFSNILNGTWYFNREGDTGFSRGAKDMQLCLISIGYAITWYARIGD